MKTKLMTGLILLTFVLAACGGAPTQTAPEPAAPTQAESQPTVAPTATPVPPTEPPAPTETSAPETEAPAASDVSFANDVMPIFQNSCIGCHGGDQTRAGLDLKTYDSLMAGSVNGAVVVPGNPGESWVVKLTAEGKMPKRGDKLTPEQVQTLTDWIAAGALNN